jgi:serine/threonine protein kinase
MGAVRARHPRGGRGCRVHLWGLSVLLLLLAVVAVVTVDVCAAQQVQDDETQRSSLSPSLLPPSPSPMCSFDVLYSVSELSATALEATMTVTSNRDESAPLQVVYWFEGDGDGGVGMEVEYVTNAVIVSRGDGSRGMPTRLKTGRSYSQGQRAEIKSSVRAVARGSGGDGGGGQDGQDGGVRFGQDMGLGLRHVNVNGVMCERKGGKGEGVAMGYARCVNAISFFTSFNGRPPPTGGATDECAMEFCCGLVPAAIEEVKEVIVSPSEVIASPSEVIASPSEVVAPSGGAAQDVEGSQEAAGSERGVPAGGSSGGVLIGVVVGVAVVLVGIFLASYFVIRRRRRERMVGDGADKGGGNSQASTPRKQLSLRSTASGFSTPTNKVSVAATTVGVASHHLATQNSLATQSSLHSQHSGLPTPIDNLPDDLPEDVILHEKLGAGAFGTVFKGEWGGHSVAVKVLQTAYATDSREMDSFRQEIAVLSGLRHPNIVAFLAACTIPPDICIVEELAEGGSLHAKLHGVSGSENRCRPLPAGAVIRLAIDVAKAMVYLHPNIVHRDLKSQNVLLDADGRAKVCDFGIAKFKDRTFVSTVNGQAGTPAYMAPELFDGMNATEKVDVYSFAILLWECITGKVPWGHVPSPMQIIYYVGVLNQRPALPSDDSVPGDLVQLIEDCWVVDPKQRPGFDEVLRRLRAMQAEHVEAAMERAPEVSERVGVISEVTSRPSSAASEGADEPTRAPAKGEPAGDSAVSGGDQLVREGSLENPEGSLENTENTEYTGENTGENTGSIKVGRRTSSVAIVASSTGDLKSFPVRP